MASLQVQQCLQEQSTFVFHPLGDPPPGEKLNHRKRHRTTEWIAAVGTTVITLFNPLGDRPRDTQRRKGKPACQSFSQAEKISPELC